MKKKDSFSVKMFYRNLCCFFFNLDMLYFCSRIWFEFYFMAIITVLLKTLPPLTVGKSPLIPNIHKSIYKALQSIHILNMSNCYGLNCVSQNLYVEVLIPSTLECDVF